MQISDIIKNMNMVVNISIKDVIDILIVSVIFYKIALLIKETRAEQLMKGIITVFIVAQLSEVFKLYTINWMLENTMTVGVIALLIVFQPELRRILEYIGRSNIFKKSLIEIKNEESKKIVTEIVHAVESLSRQKIGALIVIEKQTGLTDVLETGTLIDAEVSSELLINIFIPNIPLHDGAVIIKNERIRAAACFLPLTENKSLSKELGTRHRAALGISEKSDALTIVISEETGIISVAEAGELNRHIDGATLRQILTKLYASSDASIFNTWRNKYGSD